MNSHRLHTVLLGTTMAVGMTTVLRTGVASADTESHRGARTECSAQNKDTDGAPYS